MTERLTRIRRRVLAARWWRSTAHTSRGRREAEPVWADRSMRLDREQAQELVEELERSKKRAPTLR